MSRVSLLILVLACLAGSVRAQPAMLVMDGSASMWGRLGGETKIAAAREAVAGLMARWPAGRPVGLVAYGHRRARDCTDVEMLRGPGSGAAAVAAAVRALTPRGRTPFADAVRLAAEALGPEGGSIILVTDGIESCHPDPCGIAQHFARTGAKLVLHTIGFAVADPAAIAQLRCMAEATGGRSALARDEAELATALEAAAAATAPGRRAASPRAETVPQPRLIVTLRLCAACDPMTGDARLVLRRGEEEVAVDGEPFGRFFDLPPGDYAVQAVTPLFVHPPVPVTVPESGVGRAEIVLNAGWLVGEVRSEPSGRPVPAGVDLEWWLGSGPAVGAGPSFLLPAGDRRLVVRLGNVAGEAEAVLGPGDVAVRRIGLRFGVLVLAPAAPGETPAVVTVTAADGDGAFGEWRTVPGRRLPLAPGRYRVAGEAGAAEVRIESEREVEVALPSTE